MMSKAMFGRYWPADSIIHRIDARTKLVGMIVLIVMLFLADNWPAMAFNAVMIMAFFAVARIPLNQAIRSILPILFIVILTVLFNVLFVQGGEVYLDLGWLRISEDGVKLALFVGLRLILLLLLGSLLTMTTTSMDITEGIERLLAPFWRIGLPVHEFAFVVGTALRFLPQFADEFRSIRAAQISRGARLSTSPVRGVATLTSFMVPLFASVFRHADTLSEAMEARCYRGAIGRTRLHPLRFHGRDIVAAVCIAVFLITTVLLSKM